MTRVLSAITTSIDGFYCGPDDRPGLGMGEDGERLHDWMFGGATDADRRLLEERRTGLGAVIGGRTTYDNAEAWGGSNPYPVPMFIVTHRLDEEPPGGEFRFADSLETALERARAAAGDRDVLVMGGGSLIRQAFEAGAIDELTLSVAPFVLGGGKRLFEGVERSIDMEPIETHSSPLATHITYRVRR